MFFVFPEQLPAGAVLDDNFRVTAHLGAGGMADVYLGRQLDLDTDVAIKVLKRVVDDDHRAVFNQRFVREARAAARINHPNVVRMLAYREAMTLRLSDGNQDTFQRPFLVMEHLVGRDLAQVLADEGALAPTRIWSLIRGCLQGLAAGHALGIVHKDLKPSNLFLVQAQAFHDESLRILDFGVARVGPSMGSPLTGTGEHWCTPAYAAPEYVERQHVSPAIDVYQMGLIIAEMLTGQRVVMGTTPFHMFMEHTRGVALPDTLEEGPLRDILTRATSHDPDARYPDASALHDALAVLDWEAIAFKASPAERALAIAPTSPSPRASLGLADTALIDDTLPASPMMVDAEPTPAMVAASNTSSRPQSRSTMVWMGAVVLIVGIAAGVWVANQTQGTPPSGHVDASNATPPAADTRPMASAPRSVVSTGVQVSKVTPATTTSMRCAEGEVAEGSICRPAEMRVIGGGVFWRGCHEASGEVCADSERPGAEVMLSPFLIDQSEVSVARYRACVEAKGCTEPARATGQFATWTSEDSTLPINGIDWSQAHAFCLWEGKRLPTEAEWERAARGHSGNHYPWGNTPLASLPKPVANVADEAASKAQGWFKFFVGYNDGVAALAAVDRFVMEDSKIHGLVGNVREWIADCYDPAYYAVSPTRDPRGPEVDVCHDRVVRGAYFGAHRMQDLRAAARFHASPDAADFRIGARCARDLKRRE